MLFLSGCENIKTNSTHKDVSQSSIRKGKVLAEKYCQSCHLLPDPSLLDAKTWEMGVLPAMGPRLGIFHYGIENYPSYVNDSKLDPNYYPKKPLLSFEDWQNIIDYYTSVSPDSLPKQDRKQAIQMDLTVFSAMKSEYTYTSPGVSYVKINSDDSLHPLVIGDVLKKDIYFFNRQLKISDSIGTRGPIVDINFSKNEILACNIGILNPNNEKAGKAELLSLSASQKLKNDNNVLFDSLRRPVQITPADLNNDGKTDYLVCEFGNLMGALSWMENSGDGKFKRHVLRNVPGAIKAYINDYNHDGNPDVWALFAQGEEGIFLFTNKGNGNFESKEVLRFPSVYGSSYFEMDDFNKDGYPDIVYTCGDNADFSIILKPYHGVYVFLNDGKNNFTQKYFYPINGCYKAIARDFDGDGDMDIATISFFADYKNQPEEGFVYLEQKGDFNFIPHSLPEAESGHWLTMDAGDFDGDGKIDLVLGNFSVRPSATHSEFDWKKGPVFLLLKNQSSGPSSK